MTVSDGLSVSPPFDEYFGSPAYDAYYTRLVTDDFTGNRFLDQGETATVNFSDVDPTATVSIIEGPKGSTFQPNGNGSYTYTPRLDFTGTDVITYRVNTDAAVPYGYLTFTVSPVSVKINAFRAGLKFSEIHCSPLTTRKT